jgi:hypothetical protein
VTPEVKLLHLESATRVPGPVQPEELALLRERWGQLLAADPYYHWRFVAGSADFVMPLYRANGTFLPDRGLRRDLILVGQYLSDGGPRLLITRVLSRLRGTSPTPPSS